MKRYVLFILILCCYIDTNAQVKCFQGFQDFVKDTWDNIKEAVDAMVVGSIAYDPNEIVGPEGYDTLRWVGINNVLNYTIYFENDPEFATASAQMVDVRFDFEDKGLMKNFGIGDYSFANMSFPVQRKSNAFQNRIDLKDSLGYFVDLIAGLDVVKKQAFWTFTTIDPATGYAPWQSGMGMLPVNDSTHVGEGFVTFSLTPAKSMRTGDIIELSARIVFDNNDTIETNTWMNTVDAGMPVSKVKVESDDENGYKLAFTAEDDKGGSGIKHLLLYMANHNGEYEEIACCSPDSIMLFPVEKGQQYFLYSLAVDNAGNREEEKRTPDVILNFNMPPTDIQLSDSVFRDDLQPRGYVGKLSTVDSDEGGVFSYELVEGDGALHNDYFSIDNDVLRIKNSFKCSEDSLFKVRIRSTDDGNASFAKSFTLSLDYVLERPEPDTLSVSVCEGDSYEFYGSFYDEPGVYIYTTDNDYMCDSVHVLILTVEPLPQEPIITVKGASTLVSSSVKGNQWYTGDGIAIEGAVEQEFTPQESGVYYVEVSNGVCHSVPSRKYYVNVNDYVEYELSVAEGWNWVSTNIDDAKENSAEGFLGPIKHAVLEMDDGENVIYPAMKTVAIQPESSYRLHMKESVSCIKTGIGYAPEKKKITLNEGWNRIGYIPGGDMLMEDALVGLKPSENDVIKSLDEFAVYSNGKWNGTMKKMSPGEGYMYYSAGKNEFYYPVSRVFEVEDSVGSYSMDNGVWNFNMHKYADNMTIVASLFVDNVPAIDGIYTVAAFVGEECRGKGIYIDGLLYIVVNGTAQNDEVVSFKAYDNVTDACYDVEESLVFDAMHHGSIMKPFKLSLLNDMSVGASVIGLNIYPNPVKSVMYVAGDNGAIKTIKILTPNGDVVLVHEGYNNEGIYVRNLSSGIYVVAISTDRGYYYSKIIKM